MSIGRHTQGRLADLDWILETDPTLAETLTMAARWPEDEALRRAAARARRDVAARLGIHVDSLYRLLRRTGRDAYTLRPSVDRVSDAV